MMDQRWRELAHVLVDYSTGVQPGERVMIAMVELAAHPLTQAVYEAAIQAGALPQVQFLSERQRHAVMKHGSPEQVGWVPEIEAYGMAWADVYFGLRGAHNPYQHADIPAEVLAASQRAMGQISAKRWEETRWCLVRVPSASFAQQAETDLETVTDMFFDACLLDWESEAQAWHRAARTLERGSQVRVVGRSTDLRFSVEGRRWVVGDGRINMPDGELYTAPVNDTLNGHISFEFPGVFGGRLIHDIRLAWEHGQLVEALASTNQDYLHRIIETDEGASRLGEFGIGLNPRITRFCKDILLDEKIGGTVHIALGRAYPDCGGRNSSAIHWDIVKDLRHEGSVTLDGQAVVESGELLVG